jgi:hypothetical protein
MFAMGVLNSRQAINIYIGLIAVFYAALGVWVAAQSKKIKVGTILVEKEVDVSRLEDCTIAEIELKT